MSIREKAPSQRRKGAKFLSFSLRLCAFASICLSAVAAPQQPYGTPTTVATLKNRSITESSGLTTSRSKPGAYWTHNDSGDGPYIYAFNGQGASLGVFRVTGAKADDWEDIAIGPGPEPGKWYLYIGDIGDNNATRSEIVVYRVAEPILDAATAKFTKANPGTTESAEAIRLRYPDGKFDSETLLVHPVTGNIYVLTKVVLVSPVVYEVATPSAGKVITMKRIGEIRVPSLFGGVLTGGSISPDGRRIAFCDYFQGYELVLPAKSSSFDDIWKQRMTGFDLGKRNQGEAITYRHDGKAFIATSEGANAPIIQVVRN